MNTGALFPREAGKESSGQKMCLLLFQLFAKKPFCALPRAFCLTGSLAFRLLPPSRPAYQPHPLRGHPYRPARSSLPQPYASLRRVNRAWFKDKTKSRASFNLIQSLSAVFCPGAPPLYLKSNPDFPSVFPRLFPLIAYLPGPFHNRLKTNGAMG